jgi:hypothetical protein
MRVFVYPHECTERCESDENCEVKCKDGVHFVVVEVDR